MEINKIYGQCRCCLANGLHRDLMQEYYADGEREVYYDLFRECFNVYLSINNKLSRLICASCIHRLRAANDFRMLAMRSEADLLMASGVQETMFVNMGESETYGLKAEAAVKPEPPERAADSDGDIADGASDCDSDSVLEARLLSRYPTPRRLPTRATLRQVYPRFAAALDRVRGKEILPEMIEELLDPDSWRRNSEWSPFSTGGRPVVTEKVAQISNACLVIENSNVTLFKSKNRNGFPCFYCRCNHETLEKLRQHQTATHKRSEARKVLFTYGCEALVVYVDVTDLECTICNTPVPSLKELRHHLTKKHGKEIHAEYMDKVVPFKLAASNVYECQICWFSFETFGSIERHMNNHFRNYVCKECGSGFITKYRLKVHMKSMHTGSHNPCPSCSKVFASPQKLKNHVATVHKLVKRFKCLKCPERFSEYFCRQKHMVNVHGLAPLKYKCNVCEKSFDRRYTLSRHMKRDHLEERDFQCEMCAYKCFTSSELRTHMVKHSGERLFECSVCNKSYARKKTLKEHMRIHDNDRRFTCGLCGQAFVQKCSLKSHMKTHHVDYTMPD